MKFAYAIFAMIYLLCFASRVCAGDVEIEDHYVVALHTSNETGEVVSGESAEEYVQRVLPLLKEATLENREKYEDGLYKGVVIEEYDRIDSIWEGAKGFSARLTPDAVARLKNFPEVKTVENDAIINTRGDAIQTSAPWQLDRIDQRAYPLDGIYEYDYDGSGVHIYVLDDAFYPAPDFDTRLGASRDVVNNSSDVTHYDCEFFGMFNHGTAVAGLAVGTTGGVAKGATVHGVQIYGCDGNITTTRFLDGLDWIRLNHQTPAVAIAAISTSSSTALINNETEKLINAGVLLVTSAGNGSVDACLFAPNSANGSLTVGAAVYQFPNSTATQKDVIARYSNWGDCVDIIAPGRAYDVSNVYWYAHLDHEPPRYGYTDGWYGTSVSAPIVGGIAAILLEEDPNLTPAELRSKILSISTKDQVISEPPRQNYSYEMAYSRTPQTTGGGEGGEGGEGDDGGCGESCTGGDGPPGEGDGVGGYADRVAPIVTRYLLE